MKIELKSPIVIDDTTISSVTLRRPKVKDLRAMSAAVAANAKDPDGGDLAGTLAILSRVTGLTAEQVEEMDAEDFATLSRILEGAMAGASSGVDGGVDQEPADETSPPA